MSQKRSTTSEIPEPAFARLLFSDIRLAPLWLVARLGIGFVWLAAGMDKLMDVDGTWVGANAGAALRGFIKLGLAEKTEGLRPDITGWYASFLRDLVLPHSQVFAVMVTFGELLVGVALIAGIFTGIAAFFGGLMNTAFLMAGALTINPLMFIITTGLVLAWRTAGYWGADRFVLPRVGVPGAPGTLFHPVTSTPSMA